VGPDDSTVKLAFIFKDSVIHDCEGNRSFETSKTAYPETQPQVPENRSP